MGSIVVTDDTTRDLMARLHEENWQAKREVCVVLVPDRLSKWDVRHQHINDMLDELVTEYLDRPA